MKFTCTVDINLPRNRVVELLNDPENLQHWQDGFISYTHLSGEAGKVGAKALMKYQIGRNKIDLVETITVNNFPEEFTGDYENEKMTNTMQNLLTELEGGGTRWTAHLHYYQINGFFMKTLAKIFPSMFKRQTQKWMDQFRDFCEAQ